MERQLRPKKPYRKPRLKIYGDIRALTGAKAGRRNDGASNPSDERLDRFGVLVGGFTVPVLPVPHSTRVYFQHCRQARLRQPVDPPVGLAPVRQCSIGGKRNVSKKPDDRRPLPLGRGIPAELPARHRVDVCPKQTGNVLLP